MGNRRNRGCLEEWLGCLEGEMEALMEEGERITERFPEVVAIT
jgi:hypothetical protein